MITIWKTPIVATVEQVLKDLKLQLYGAGLLKEIKNTGSDLMCTCPFHANGKEHNPSCGVLLQQKVTKDKTYEAGTVHCYTCGYTADLPQFVADLLGLSSPVEGFKWLVNQYNYQTEERELPDLDMYRGSTAKSSVLEESLVKQYTQNLLQSEEACRYLHKRRIANWVLEAYELGFDPEDKTVLFPVRGMDGKVIFYKGRSIAGKHFYNAKEVDKTSVVFGLWEILNGSFSWGTSDQIEEVWITESEIDALSLISYGVPAVKLDVRKYYPSIVHDVLKAKYRELFKDEELIWLMDEIIDSISTCPATEENIEILQRLGVAVNIIIDDNGREFVDGVGIPIGNYVSQYDGNFNLSVVDHWLKEVKGVKYYFRYMDDMVIFGSSKEELHKLKRELDEFMAVNLKQVLKHNWQVFPTKVRGVDFVGYRFFGEYTLLRKSTCKTFKRRMLSISSKRENNVSPTYSEWCSFNSYVGWLQHCDSFRLYQKYVEPNVEYMHNYYLKEVKGNAEICKRKNYSGERKAS